MAKYVNLPPTSGYFIWHIYKLSIREGIPIERARSITRSRIKMERNIRLYYKEEK